MTGEVKAIKGGRVIDGTGADPIENTTVLVQGSKIKAVGKDIEIPREAEVIDATGKTVMPGLIDSHVHLYGFVTDAFRSIEGIVRPSELGLIKAIKDAKVLLAAGFTTARDPAAPNSMYLKAAVAEGTLSGIPRIATSGFPLSQTSGHFDYWPYAPLDRTDARTSIHRSVLKSQGLVCDGVLECIKATRHALRWAPDFIKVSVTGGPYPYDDTGARYPHTTQFSLDELKAIVETAAQEGKFVTAHCENSRGAKNAILAGVKCLEHCYEIDDEVIALAKEHGTYFVSTKTPGMMPREAQMGPSAFGFFLPLEKMRANKEERFGTLFARSTETYKKIVRAGLILGAGSTCNSTPGNDIGMNAIALEILVKYHDFTPMEAIVAATKNGAIVSFLGDKTGTLEPGKLADVIVVDGDPLADISLLRDVEKIKMVMLEGKVEVDRGL